MPDFAFPQFDINKTAADVNNAVKEGAYVAVGLGVLGFQRAQVRRVELAKQIEAQLAELSDLPTTFGARVEAYRKVAATRAEAAGSQLADQLNDLAKYLDEALTAARERIAKAVPADAQFEAARAQLTEFAKTVDERVQPARQQFDEQIDRLEQNLPSGARNIVQSVRAAAAAPEQLLRSAVGLA